MGMVVQHNLTAMNSNRMLGVTSSAQAKSTEKLSSGYKINRAADDAAGLSISEKMRKQIRGLTQASSNAQDGISAVQTAEGALTEVHDMLQRMNELAVKSANSTNSASDRDAIQAEIDQLVTEIDRVAETTKFNETYLLKGDKNGEIKTDYQYKSTAEITTQDLYYVKDGEVNTIKAGSLSSALDSSMQYFTSDDPKTAGAKADFSGADSTLLEDKNVLSQDYYLKDGEDFVLVNKGAVYDSGKEYYSVTYDSDNTIQEATKATASTEAVKVLASDKTLYDEDGNKLSTGATVDTTGTYFTSKGDITLTGEAVTTSDYVKIGSTQLQDKDGNEIAANGLHSYFNDDGTYKGGLYLASGDSASAEDVASVVDTAGKYETGALKLKLHVGADATDNNQITLDIDAMSAKGLGINGLKVDGSDDTNARNAIETIAAALSRVSEQRSALGAVQNRLEHTINNLDNVVENTTSAESAIRDTDMASEMVKYSNNNILAQAGTSMLAQANQSNQNILSLLG